MELTGNGNHDKIQEFVFVSAMSQSCNNQKVAGDLLKRGFHCIYMPIEDCNGKIFLLLDCVHLPASLLAS